MDSENLVDVDKARNEKTVNGGYIAFDKFNTASEARDKLQIAPEWSDAKIRTEFDTKQILDKITIPTEKGNTTKIPEPITHSYPENGKGGYRQAHVDKKLEIKIDNVEELKE